MFPEELLLKGADEMKLHIDSQRMEQFKRFFKILLEWNERLNLTRITEPEEVVTKHYLDSFAPAKLLAFREGERVCDVGAGAGFPGIPLKILYPGIHVTLIDSQKKKVSFLKTVINQLGLTDIEAVHGRGEELGRKGTYRETYDKVLARAVAPLSVLLELSLPFAALGGVFIAYKGPKASEEVQEAKKAIEILGGEIEKIENIKIPFLVEKRVLVIIGKKNKTPEEYPRRPGVPEKKPL